MLVVACGDRKINTKKLGKELDAKKVRFADADSVLRYTGFAPGGVCPFGLDSSITICLDQSLYDYEVVYAAAGTANSALPIAPERLREILAARVIEVSQ